MGNRQAARLEQASAAGEAAAAAILQASNCGKNAALNATKPELIYFDGAGRGQLTRLAFAAGGVDFIDTRISMSNEWPAIKGDPESVPGKCFGSVPCIKHGDHIFAQSRATAIYAAELGIWAQGRLGSNAVEESVNGATEGMVLGAHADMQAAMYKCLFGDDDIKAEGKKNLPAAAATLLAGLERVLERKKCAGSFFFCEIGPTLADLAVYDMIESPFPGLKALGVDLIPYPKVRAVAEAVQKDSNIATYILQVSMGKPELIYFDGPGRAQLTRLAFAVGGIDFVDTRIPQADWPALKSNLDSVPAKCFGSMPCIKHGDVLLAQSQATASYAAGLGIWKQGRLGADCGTAAVNRSTEMMVLGAHADIQANLYKCLFGDDETKAKGKEALEQSAPKALAALERILARKACDGPFFFCEVGPTLADLAVYDVIESPFPGLKALGIDVTPYPKCCAVAAAVADDANVKALFSK